MQTYVKAGRYPITADQIKAENPNVSFPQYIQAIDVEPLGYFAVESTTPDYNPEVQVCTETTPALINGKWKKQWSIRVKTQEEIDAENAAKAAQAEAARKAAIPTTVTMRQARRALAQAGKLAVIEATIDALPEPDKTAAKIEWEYAQDVTRHYPFTQMLIAAAGLTETETDDLFTLAATL